MCDMIILLEFRQLGEIKCSTNTMRVLALRFNQAAVIGFHNYCHNSCFQMQFISRIGGNDVDNFLTVYL